MEVYSTKKKKPKKEQSVNNLGTIPTGRLLKKPRPKKKNPRAEKILKSFKDLGIK